MNRLNFEGPVDPPGYGSECQLILVEVGECSMDGDNDEYDDYTL